MAIASQVNHAKASAVRAKTQEDQRSKMGLGLLGLYAIILFLSVYTLRTFLTNATLYELSCPNTRHYALQVDGLPPDASPMEICKYFSDWIRNIPVVGVSVVYKWNPKLHAHICRGVDQMLVEHDERR